MCLKSYGLIGGIPTHAPTAIAHHRRPSLWQRRPVTASRPCTLQSTCKAAAAPKELWVQTTDKSTFLAALEGGVGTFVFGPDPQHAELAAAWGGLARFTALIQQDPMQQQQQQQQEEGGKVQATWGGGERSLLLNEDGQLAGEVVRVCGPEDTRALEARVRAMAAVAAGGQGAGGAAESPNVLIMDAQDWKVIPAENLVALAQPAAGSVVLLAAAGSAGEGRLMLEALEGGTAGVLLRTQDPGEVRELVRYTRQRAADESATPALSYSVATVRRVAAAGMGDRACVDLACLLQPGEGMLVGNFARCLALVHSECDASDYIASRPFRVNAGPVHAYVSAPGGRTRYLCELSAGDEVAVADAAGRLRTAVVGRVKIERRPLVMVELETTDPEGTTATHSVLLQNAETVKLVGPAAAAAPSSPPATAIEAAPVPQQPAPQAQPASVVPLTLTSGKEAGCTTATTSSAPSSSTPDAAARVPSTPAEHAKPPRAGASPASGGPGSQKQVPSWRTLSVSSLRPGDQVFVLLQPPARHTGIAIEEFIVEK